MLIRRIQRVKACDDHPAPATHIMPLHGEQAHFARMQKKVNDLGLIAPMIGRVLDWIDPDDLIVRRRPHESFQLPNQIVMVRITSAESVETRSKTWFAYCGCLVAHSHTLPPPAIQPKIPSRSSTPPN